MNKLFYAAPFHSSIGILLIRLGLGLIMMFAHGWSKLMNFAERSATFPDPLGVGSQASLTLAVFAEVFCSLLLILGLATRLSLIPLIITMVVAVFIIHADDPFARQELGLLFLIPYIALMFTGPGKYSLDWFISRKGRR